MQVQTWDHMCITVADVKKQLKNIDGCAVISSKLAATSLYDALTSKEARPSISPSLSHDAVCVEVGSREVSAESHNGLSWTLEDVTLQDIVVYKVLGDEPTLREYNQFQLDAIAQQSYGGNAKFDKNWAAMYTQFMKSHTIGTVAYRWEAKSWRPAYSEARLVEVQIKSVLPVIIVTGSIFWDGAADSGLKANLVKEALRSRGWDIGVDEGLMEALGRKRRALVMQETEHEWELIFEQSHLAEVLVMPTSYERLVATFYKDKVMPITSHWQPAAEQSRRRCDDLDRCADCLADLGEVDLPSRFTSMQ